ncbi:unnamed protein product, partial [Trichobilharzia szidati]
MNRGSMENGNLERIIMLGRYTPVKVAGAVALFSTTGKEQVSKNPILFRFICCLLVL